MSNYKFNMYSTSQTFSLDFMRLLCGVDGDPNNSLRFVFGLPGSACGSWNLSADRVCGVLADFVCSVVYSGVEGVVGTVAEICFTGLCAGNMYSSVTSPSVGIIGHHCLQSEFGSH